MFTGIFRICMTELESSDLNDPYVAADLGLVR